MNALSRIALVAAPPVRRLSHAPHTDNMCDPWDITDVYIEETGEDDHEVAAYFDHNASWGEYAPTLVGLRITDGSTVQYYNAEGAWVFLSMGAINRIEQAYGVELVEGLV